MTQEEKSLLLQDLCARLPYGVKVHLSRKHNRPEEDIVLNNVIINKDGFVISNIIGYNYLLSEIKPYLRPLSSMTNEEKAELKAITDEFGDNWLKVATPEERWKCTFLNLSNEIDWLNAHHFDYRGLIPMGLGIDCTGLNVYENEKSM